MTRASLQHEPPTRVRPTTLITARELRANLRAVMVGEDARVVGTRSNARCIVLPIPVFEHRGKRGMDRRLTETRRRFEAIMATLER
jgi:hypothetical protein